MRSSKIYLFKTFLLYGRHDQKLGSRNEPSAPCPTNEVWPLLVWERLVLQTALHSITNTKAEATGWPRNRGSISTLPASGSRAQLFQGR